MNPLHIGGTAPPPPRLKGSHGTFVIRDDTPGAPTMRRGVTGTIPHAPFFLRSRRSIPQWAISRATWPHRSSIERAAVGGTSSRFPELAITGYPPEDLLLKPAFIEANLRAWPSRRRRPGSPSIVGFVDKRDDTSTTRRRSCTTASVAGVYHKQYLPNYGVFDENRYFQAGHRDAGLHAGRRHLRRQHLRGHLVPDRADERSGAGRARAGRQHHRLALPRRQGATASGCSPRAPPTTSSCWPT